MLNFITFITLEKKGDFKHGLFQIKSNLGEWAIELKTEVM